MTNKEFSEKILKSSRNHWVFVLKGQRNLGYKRASLVAQLLDTSLEVWLDSRRVAERLAAWDKFNEQEA